MWTPRTELLPVSFLVISNVSTCLDGVLQG